MRTESINFKHHEQELQDQKSQFDEKLSSLDDTIKSMALSRKVCQKQKESEKKLSSANEQIEMLEYQVKELNRIRGNMQV